MLYTPNIVRIVFIFSVIGIRRCMYAVILISFERPLCKYVLSIKKKKRKKKKKNNNVITIQEHY